MIKKMMFEVQRYLSEGTKVILKNGKTVIIIKRHDIFDYAGVSDKGDADRIELFDNKDISCVLKSDSKFQIKDLEELKIEEKDILSLPRDYKSFKYYEKKYNNTKIKKMISPIGNHVIYRHSFINLKEIEEIIISNKTSFIGEDAFKLCEKLQRVELPDTLIKICNYSFEYCISLKYINIPETVTDIERYAFSKCSSLEMVDLPKSLNKIYENCFYDCLSLRRINMQEGLKEIGKHAFLNCVSLEKIVLPKSLEIVGDDIFYKCSSLKEIIINANPIIKINEKNENFYNSELIIKYDNELELLDFIKNNRKLLRRYIENNRNNNKNIRFIGPTISLEYQSEIDGLIDKKIGYTIEPNITVEKELSTIIVPNDIKIIKKEMYSWNDNIKKIVIPDSVEEIEPESFKYCSSLEEIVLPAKLEKLASSTFLGCKNLKKIVLPQNLKTIEEDCFLSCESIDNLILPDSVEYIGSNAFNNCKSLKNIKLSNSLKIINDNCFLKCRSLENIEIPEGVEEIKNTVFAFCYNLNNIKFPSSLKKIGVNAFQHCDSLKEVIIPEGVEEIEDASFYCCNGLNTITLPSTLNYIGKRVVSNCDNLNMIITTKNNEKLIKEFLKSCNNGKNVNLKIGDRIITQDSSDELTIEEGTRILERVIDVNKTIKKIFLPNSLEEIQSFAFEQCSELEEIVIPNSVKRIYSKAFFDCKKLKKVTLSNSLEYISNSLFSNCEELTSIEIPEGVTSIGVDAFTNCKKLKKVVLPSTLKYICDCAFIGCESLEDLSIPDNVEIIGVRAFEGCPKLKIDKLPKNLKTLGSLPPKKKEKLESIIIPNGVERIDSGTFKDCKNLKTIRFPNTLKRIDYYVFSGCEALEKVYLPNSVEQVGDGTFSNCTSLKEVGLSKNLKELGSNLFENCTSLKEIVIPNNVEDIKEGVFNNCSNLERIFLPNNLKSIESFCNECPSLKELYLLASSPVNLMTAVKKEVYSAIFARELVIPYTNFSELDNFISNNSEFLKLYIKNNNGKNNTIRFVGNPLSVYNIFIIVTKLRTIKGFSFERYNINTMNQLIPIDKFAENKEINEILTKISNQSTYLPYEIKYVIEMKIHSLFADYNEKVEKYKPKYTTFEEEKNNLELEMESVYTIRMNLISSLNYLSIAIERFDSYNELIKDMTKYKKLLTEPNSSFSEKDEIALMINKIKSVQFESNQEKDELFKQIIDIIQSIINQIEDDVGIIFRNEPFTEPSNIDYKKLLLEKLNAIYSVFYETIKKEEEKKELLKELLDILNKEKKEVFKDKDTANYLTTIFYIINIAFDSNITAEYDKLTEVFIDEINKLLEDEIALTNCEYKRIIYSIRGRINVFFNICKGSLLMINNPSRGISLKNHLAVQKNITIELLKGALLFAPNNKIPEVINDEYFLLKLLEHKTLNVLNNIEENVCDPAIQARIIYIYQKINNSINISPKEAEVIKNSFIELLYSEIERFKDDFYSREETIIRRVELVKRFDEFEANIDEKYENCLNNSNNNNHKL